MLRDKDNVFFNTFAKVNFDNETLVCPENMERMTVNNETFFRDVISLLRQGKRVTIPVKGTSMLPYIVGEVDLVVLEGVEAASPEDSPHRNADKGDIVLFRANNHFVLHRILDFDANGVAVIQGDGILKAKEHCGRDGIFGRVVLILKQGKHPIDVESKGYRLKIRLWLMAVPFRRILLGVWRRLFLRPSSPGKA